MGNFTKLQEEQRDAKEKAKLKRETLGKFFYDLAKIVFTGLVIGGVISIASGQYVLNNSILLMLGIIATYILVHIGYNIIKS